MSLQIGCYIRFPVPRQELGEPIGRMTGDHPLEHVPQVGIGFYAVQLAGFDERADCRPSLTTAIRPSK